MLKSIYIFSLLFFIIICIIPFRDYSITYLEPKINATEKKDPEDRFVTTALKKEYVEESLIYFTEAKDLNKDAPMVSAESALVIDMNTNKIIYAKNEEVKKPVASLAKVMTAIIAVEHAKMDEKIKISSTAAKVGENTMGLKKDEKFTLEELLYGLILDSGNDSAYAIAEHVGKTEQEFVKFMNRKANLLGAYNTKFVDSSGLNSQNKEFYSTAIDMAKMAVYSQNNHKELKKIYATFIKELPETEEHEYKYLENQTNLLTTYPGDGGMKTGYTEEAGLCLISYAENDGKKVLVVILYSTDRRGDSILLLDYGFNQLGVHVEHNLL